MTYYVLTKLSNPGWNLGTGHQEIILDKLEGKICSGCKLTEAEYKQEHPDYRPQADDTDQGWFPEDYDDLSTEAKLLELLGSTCGIEYSLEVYSTYEEYVCDIWNNSKIHEDNL